MTLRNLTESQVTFTYEIEMETDIPVEGNYMDTEDDEADKAAEKEILYRLRNDDYLAWCCLSVTATWNNYNWTATLGACSFERNTTEEEIWNEYGAELRAEALDYLNQHIKEQKEILDSLEA